MAGILVARAIRVVRHGRALPFGRGAIRGARPRAGKARGSRRRLAMENKGGRPMKREDR